jgi:hypothetical protein
MKLSTRSSRILTSVLLVTLVAACGGGGGDTPAAAVPTTAAQCYTLTNGNESLYALTPSPATYSSAGTTTVSSHAQGLRNLKIQAATFNGAPAQSILVTGTNTFTLPVPMQKPFAKTESFYTYTDTKFNIVGYRDTPVGSVPFDTVITGLSRSLNLAVGASETYTYAYSASSPGSTVTSTYEETLQLLAIEDVTTPAGTFKNACKFSAVRTRLDAQPQVLDPSTFWVASGWGVVKEINVRTYTDGRTPAVRTYIIEATSILKGNL